MAIQVRRGNYADLDTTKLVAGEPFVTLDQLNDGDYYVGMAISPSTTVRLATYSNIQTIKAECEQYAEDAGDSADAASTSETNAEQSAEDSEAWAVGKRDGHDVPSSDPTYNNNAKYWAEQAAQASGVSPATPSTLGIVKPDNTTINVDGNGVISGYALGETTETVYEGIKGKANADNIATIQGLIPSTATTSNKLATDDDTVKSGMSAEILTRRTVGYTAKNLLHVLPSVVDTTDNGITYTITRNTEGEVTEIELNGTATADSTLMLNDGFDVKNQTTGTLLISGFENASSHTNEYKLFFERVSGTIRRSYIKVYSGVTVTNLLCHPMVRDSKSTDIFEPYHNPLMDTIDDITDVIPSNASSSNKLATASDIPSVEPLTSEHLTALRTIIQG